MGFFVDENCHKYNNRKFHKNLQNVKGFTVPELLLIILLFAIIAATAIPIGTNAITKNDFINKIGETTLLVKTAQLNSQLGKEDSRWGVAITNDSITLFKGDSYASRDPLFDENFSIPSTVTIPPEEIVFNKLTGNPDAPATIVITAYNGESKTLTVNEVGSVDLN